MKIKRTIFLFFIIFGFCFAPAQAQAISQQPHSLDLENLVGKVKRIDEKIAEMKLKNGKLVEGWRSPSRTILFDKEGRMTYRWQKIDGVPPSETKFSYERDGRRIERTLRDEPFADQKNSPSERVGQSIFRYVASENALYHDVYPGEQLYADKPPRFFAQSQKYKYIFGDDNRLLETVDYFINTGEEATHDKNIYGEERLPIQRVLTTKGMPFKETIKYTYTLDDQGNWTKRISEDSLGDKNGTVIFRVEYRKISYYK
jgi:hypothetical protein